MLDMLEKNLDAFASGDWEACRAGLGDNAIYEEPGTQVRVEGADRFVDALKRWRRGFPDVTYTVLDSLESGNRVVAEVEWQGTHTGPLEGPFGTIPPSNKPCRVKAILMATFEGDKIVEQHHYFDLLTVLSQIGISRPIGPMPEAAAQPTAETQPLH